jgi:8-oxo-dGTP pyrophosphatase MutT (NUDIX family)
MQEEKVLLHATLCFPVSNTHVLLGVKMKKIGAERRNGWGGGIDPGETAIECIMREVYEEGRVKALPRDFEKVAVVDFENHTSGGDIFVCRVHTYLLHRWDGEFQTTAEMTDPQWFEKQNLPLDEMMPADRIWVPPLMAGKKLYAQAKYGPFQKTLLGEVKIKYLDQLAA